MRLALRFLVLLIPTLSLVLYGFLTTMRHLEREWLLKDLEQRSKLVADTLGVSLGESLRERNRPLLQTLLNRTTSDSRLIGVSVCSLSGRLVGKSDTVPVEIACKREVSKDNLFSFGGSILHRGQHTLMPDSRGAVAVLNVFQNSSHLQIRTEATQRYILFAFFGVIVLVLLVSFVVYRWTVHGPLLQLTRTLKMIASGRTKFAKRFENTTFGPLVQNLEIVLRDLRHADSSENNHQDGTWTAARLRDETTRLFGDAKICVVANREPYIHSRKGSKIEIQFPSSGLVSAVEPILRACSGLWIGHGSGSADRETADKNGMLLVPPGAPEYALKRVWLSKEEEQGYYYGFANEGLWPLCHIAHTRPTFRTEDWEQYQKVNRKFAQAFTQEMHGTRTVALIQDYHFALLPGILRETQPDTVSSLFWHIPWPNPEAIAICPWKDKIMKGMLGADLIGFHTQYHCNNFLDSVDRFMEARVDRENFSVTTKGHTCFVKPFPISIEWPPRNDAKPSEIPRIRAQLLEELGLSQDSLVGVGIDRLDYTKGIIERFLSIERLLEKYPQYIGKFVFIQIGAPSRTQIKRYQDFNSEIQEVTNRINWRFGQEGYEPIVLRMDHHDSKEVFRYYRSAQVCYVSSLHDGMNLVAKEFIAARSDEQGVLVLSSFTGAAKELTDALIINPYDIEENADALHTALTMAPSEQQTRMKRLRQVVSTNNVYNWAASFLNEIHHISQTSRTVRRLEQVI